MLKRIIDKKLEQFKSDFPDFEVSKRTGSIYTKQLKYEEKKVIIYSGRALTKNTLPKIGTKNEFTLNKAHHVYLISPLGKLMCSINGGNFKSVSLKTVEYFCPSLKNTFFIGKKYEWMVDYPALWSFRFFQSFKSLQEAKKFLGFSFISNKAFAELFKADGFDYLSPLVLAEDKKKVVKLLKNIGGRKDILHDYINMCFNNNIKVEIPAGANKLEELHNNIIMEINKVNANNYSNEYRYDIIDDEFTSAWKEKGLIFKRLSTPYEMYCQGLKQKHCIGVNYASSLDKYAFYSFSYDGGEYDLQLSPTGNFVQFYGRRNSPVPSNLRETVINTEIKKPFVIKDIKPGLEKYPMLDQNLTNIF